MRNLRVQLFRHGERVYECPGIEEVRDYCAEQMETIWEETLRFENPQIYYVDLSRKLWDMKNGLIEKYTNK